MSHDRLCGPVVRVSAYKSRGPGFNSQCCHVLRSNGAEWRQQRVMGVLSRTTASFGKFLEMVYYTEIGNLNLFRRYLQSSSPGQWHTFANVHKEFVSIPGNQFLIPLSLLLSLFTVTSSTLVSQPFKTLFRCKNREMSSRAKSGNMADTRKLSCRAWQSTYDQVDCHVEETAAFGPFSPGISFPLHRWRDARLQSTFPCLQYTLLE
jgi:hypothetical protein